MTTMTKNAAIGRMLKALTDRGQVQGKAYFANRHRASTPSSATPSGPRSSIMADVYTVTDLLNAAAEALRQGDLTALEDLRHTVQDWAQLPEETEAQVNMLEAMMGEVE